MLPSSPLSSTRQPLGVAGGDAGGLEAAEGAAGEAGDEQGGVVDRDRPPGAAAVGQRPLPDERLGQRRDPGDPVAGQVLGEVDDVGAEVAERARPGVLGLEPPGQRELGVEGWLPR